jgi:hypothetical protein
MIGLVFLASAVGVVALIGGWQLDLWLFGDRDSKGLLGYVFGLIAFGLVVAWGTGA